MTTFALLEIATEFVKSGERSSFKKYIEVLNKENEKQEKILNDCKADEVIPYDRLINNIGESIQKVYNETLFSDIDILNFDPEVQELIQTVSSCIPLSSYSLMENKLYLPKESDISYLNEKSLNERVEILLQYALKWDKDNETISNILFLYENHDEVKNCNSDDIELYTKYYQVSLSVAQQFLGESSTFQTLIVENNPIYFMREYENFKVISVDKPSDYVIFFKKGDNYEKSFECNS